MPTGPQSNGTPEGDPIQDSTDEDFATKLTRGVADGFAEASHAFSDEVAGSNQFGELMGRSVAGVIRANARLLDEVANVVRDAADGVSPPTMTFTPPNFDYDRLADMVAARLSGAESTGSGGTAS